ncbi:glycolate oxidase subunit GlcE [Pseudomonas fontis]|uniref:Glycolate oxidase subunit GlcE n=1 Tax=Pseudomonas fontis TaxID=2942633 RepID=A0ABT5NUY2_9PSED|nr:glycolate oxidase subunit GlcE [Pseudomonas fontis]MDD0973903.1 glycolate oxidase subunit GlcE [Pseudomonas fontis]MDD0991985.1 glycolate oxidase subunit GlcE [Pseudomonas fontis]
MQTAYFDPAQGSDHSEQLLEQVRQAIGTHTPLAVRGGNTKAFLGRPVVAAPLDISRHSGIVAYDPTELVITARAGTPLRELQAALDQGGQMLACEVPSFGEHATVGGMLASGLSGPRRPWVGAVRDFVLGTRMISGLGTHLRFGGEVMKNVAGYDLSRLLAGSFGCLGVITEASFKVLPKYRCRINLRQSMPLQRALDQLGEWGQQPLPLSAASHHDGVLYLRLEGNEGSVRAAAERLGGDTLDAHWWDELREQQLPFFADPRPLWRLSVPALTAPLALHGEQLLDWGGAQRWLKSEASAETIRHAVAAVGGHATCFTPGHSDSPFHPLAAPLLRYHQALKQRLDPLGIFNPGRLYADV